MTEKILAKAAEKSQVVPGDNIWVNVDVLMTHDVCGPGAFGIFKREFGEKAKVTLVFLSNYICYGYLKILSCFLKGLGPGEDCCYSRPLHFHY